MTAPSIQAETPSRSQLPAARRAGHIVMKNYPVARSFACVVLSLAAISGRAIAADPARETVAPVFAYPIAHVPGKTITSLVVSYAPGANTPAHRSEKPCARHTLSENASTTEPAKILAMLIHDAKAKDLLTFDEAKGKVKK